MENNLNEKIKRYVPTEITADASHLTKEELEVLRVLIDGARIVDRIYIRQVSKDNEALWEKLQQDTTTEMGNKILFYYWINRGPWCCLDGHKPFIEGVGARPKGANFYPDDATKEELETWFESLNEEDKKNAKGFFYTIRRDNSGSFELVPYNKEYNSFLEPLSKKLLEAATIMQNINPSMSKYLKTRAEAFLSNDYYESDVAWLEIDDQSKLDVTIGPYEVYADELFNFKATFECFIGLRDIKSTQELQKFSANLQDVEDHLPIDDKYKNSKIGTYSPIVAVNEVYSAGDVAGPQCSAFNLPNDEKVVAEKGSKRVMFKNVQEAKFKYIMQPIAGIILEPTQLKYLSFDAFFTHILCHELVHGLGPHNIIVNGSATTVRAQLKEIHSALEEAKADITGLFALKYFIDKGIVEKEKEKSFYVTFLVGAFRSIRFGLDEAHGKGQALQLNYLIEKGGIVYNREIQKYSVNFDKIETVVADLSREILTLQAEGNKALGEKLLQTYAINSLDTQSTLKLLQNVPTDIVPSFPLAK